MDELDDLYDDYSGDDSSSSSSSWLSALTGLAGLGATTASSILGSSNALQTAKTNAQASAINSSSLTKIVLYGVVGLVAVFGLWFVVSIFRRK